KHRMTNSLKHHIYSVSVFACAFIKTRLNKLRYKRDACTINGELELQKIDDFKFAIYTEQRVKLFIRSTAKKRLHGAKS
ncbi:MAG: hypothetical protein KAG95_04215, partial [Bacteroidales bacterium]|nr:hypothetical protein [Bacteroidales bacterium]